MKRERKNTGSIVNGAHKRKYPHYASLEERQDKYSRGNKKEREHIERQRKIEKK